MIDRNVILAHFWANSNHLVTAQGIEIDLHGDDNLVILSTLLRNVDDYPYTVQLFAEFSLDDFITEMEVQLVNDILEIDLNLLFVLLVCRKAGYHIMKA
ncbi:hypothetical protein D3C86_1939600 [compost metagenome]